jgi:uncharacterized protein (DUF2336 family)
MLSMTSAAPSLFSELDEAFTGTGSERRVETMRRVTDLFLANADRYDAGQIEIFDDVLSRMIEFIESHALAELSRRLAPVANAPHGVVRNLAMRDAIEVAGPVLEQSNRLTTPDLVTIASTKSQDHLLAMSGRDHLEEAVTDVLVERGNDAVARRVAVNQGAQFSHNGFSTLVSRAESNSELAETLSRRTDIPPLLFQTLIRTATEIVRPRLLAAVDSEFDDDISSALRGAAAELEKVKPTHNYSAAKRFVLPLHHDGKLNALVLADFIRLRRVDDVVLALSLLCSSRLEIIEQLVHGSQADALLIPCKVVELPWPMVKALLQLNPIHRAISPARFEQMAIDYQKLALATAQRILRFWQLRSTTELAPKRDN